MAVNDKKQCIKGKLLRGGNKDSRKQAGVGVNLRRKKKQLFYKQADVKKTRTLSHPQNGSRA